MNWRCSLGSALLACTLLAGGQVLAQQVSLVFAGDTTLDDEPGALIERGGDPLAGFAPLFAGADIRELDDLGAQVADTAHLLGDAQDQIARHERTVMEALVHQRRLNLERTYIVRILCHAVRTPLVESWRLNAITGGRVFLKLEFLQRTGSFKFRGAWNLISQLNASKTPGGVVACTPKSDSASW